MNNFSHSDDDDDGDDDGYDYDDGLTALSDLSSKINHDDNLMKINDVVTTATNKKNASQ